MKQIQKRISLDGSGRGFTDITKILQNLVDEIDIQSGVLTVFVPHTSASLLIQENADPGVRNDLETFFSKLVPDDDKIYQHSSEGSDDMPSHIRSALTQTQISIPLEGGALVLGQWQSVYFWEHRTSPRKRELFIHAFGENSISSN